MPTQKNCLKKNECSQITNSLEENEEKIIEELMAPQGEGVDLGGYYHTDPIKVRKIMRPSKTFNQIIP